MAESGNTGQESSKQGTIVKKTVERKKGLNAWQIAAIALLCLLIATLLAMLLYNLFRDGRSENNNNSDNEPKKDYSEKSKGVVVKEEKNVDKNMDVNATGEAKDANGNSIHLDSNIVNKTDINLSKEAEMAVNMETKGSCNAAITVNGDNVYGEIRVDNGYVSYYTYKGGERILRTVPKDTATITYGGSAVSDKVIDLMDSITYDASGNIIFKDCKTVVTYDDSHNATITYTNNNGDEYGNTIFNNVTKTSEGVYYSNGKELAPEYQDIFSRFDEIITLDVNNAQPKTTLNNISLENQI